MPGFEHGVERAFEMVIETLVVAALFTAFIKSGIIPKWVFVLFNLVSIIGLVFLIDKIRYWSFGYLAGWITEFCSLWKL